MANVARNITEIIGEIDSQNLHEALSEALAEVVRGVEKTGKVGSLTLTFKVKKNKDRQVMVDSEVKRKVPEEGIATTMFFSDENGNLTRRDPQQRELFNNLREVK